MTQEIETIGFEAFAIRRGCGRADMGEPGLHKAHSRINKKQWDALLAFQAAKDAKWQHRREAARAEYDELVATGRIRKPTPTDRLRAIASGQPDLPSVQAAKRALAAREAARAAQGNP